MYSIDIKYYIFLKKIENNLPSQQHPPNNDSFWKLWYMWLFRVDTVLYDVFYYSDTRFTYLQRSETEARPQSDQLLWGGVYPQLTF